MGCIVKVNRHGFLAFRLFWNKQRSWEGTGLRDTLDNRKLVEAKAVLIGREIRTGSFDYLKWFPEGNRARELAPKAAAAKTIGEYYRIWIPRKTPPVVRPGLERDYKEHFNRYILPKFEDVAFRELIPALLEAFRAYLVRERELSIKSARNIIDASFRAMVRDARTVDYLIEKDPFSAIQWPRQKSAKPDPFNEEERDAILAYFREKRPHSHPFVYTLFYTGMRPSEALALRWGDVDLRRGELSITKSRYMQSEGATKTAGSEREIRLLPSIVDLLRTVKPLHLTEDQHVFLNQEGQPINFHTWRRKAWYPALRVKEVRERKPYTMRHTFISVGLTNGVNIKWLADYCGTSVAMIEKHYGKYMRNDSEEQLNRLFGAQSATLSATLGPQAQPNLPQLAGKIRGKELVGPPGLEPGTNRL